MPLRVVFMGTPEFSVPTLAEIMRAGHDGRAPSIAQPPRPAGRGMAERESPVHAFADSAGHPGSDAAYPARPKRQRRSARIEPTSPWSSPMA